MREPENRGFPDLDFDRNPVAAEMAEIHGRAFAQGGAWSEDSFATLLSDPLVRVLKADSAFGVIRLLPGEAELLTLATDPAVQGRGLGRAILCALHDLAQRGGADRMILEVAEDNAAARALYDHLGYAQIGQRSAYYRRKTGKVGALVLACPLPTPESG